MTTTPTPTYTLSLHDALPISHQISGCCHAMGCHNRKPERHCLIQDRKSTRLNSSHRTISYAVFCLKKKRVAQAQTRSRKLSELNALIDSDLLTAFLHVYRAAP